MTEDRPGNPFGTGAEAYDAWYDTPRGKVLLGIEAACLRPLLQSFPPPRLEIGVGTGRFAEALEIEHGVDPSVAALEQAKNRGIYVREGWAERLPCGNESFGAVLMAFTLCFVQDAARAFTEVHRVLKPGGGLILGLLLQGTPWANEYARRAIAGHPLYRSAHFHSHEEVVELLDEAGFHVIAYRSTLFQPPGRHTYRHEEPADGLVEGAGFVGIGATKDGKR